MTPDVLTLPLSIHEKLVLGDDLRHIFEEDEQMERVSR